MESGVVLTLAFGVGVGVQGLVSRDSTFDLNIWVFLACLSVETWKRVVRWNLDCRSSTAPIPTMAMQPFLARELQIYRANSAQVASPGYEANHSWSLLLLPSRDTKAIRSPSPFGHNPRRM